MTINKLAPTSRIKIRLSQKSLMEFKTPLRLCMDLIKVYLREKTCTELVEIAIEKTKHHNLAAIGLTWRMGYCPNSRF